MSLFDRPNALPRPKTDAGDAEQVRSGSGLKTAMSKAPPQVLPASDIRCSACGALLGKHEKGAVSLRRGGQEALLEGAFRMTVVCHKPRCRKLNLFSIDTLRTPRSPPRDGD